MKARFSGTWNFLQSRTLALVLLALIFVAVILAWFLKEGQVISSWPFLTAAALLLLNTIACSISRIGNLLRKTGQERQNLDPTAQIANLKNRAEIATQRPPDEIMPLVAARLSKFGYRVTTLDDEPPTLFAEKGRIGEWGSIIFHLSFTIILIGVLFSGLARYEGLMIITEGQTFTDQRQDYLVATRVPILGEKYQGFQLRLNKFEATYHEGKIGTDYLAHFSILENGREVATRQVRVNQPLIYKGTTFLMERYGFAPHFALKNSSGEEIYHSYVNLRVFGEYTKDSFTIPGTGLEGVVRFYPDMIMVNDRMETASLLLNNPVMHLVLSNGDTELFQGPLALGGTATFEGGSLSFTDVRYWTFYRVVRDVGGEEMVFAGFWMAVAGLSLRYLTTRKRIWAVIGNREGTTELIISGIANQFDSLYNEEFNKIVTSLEKDIQHGSN